MPLRRLGAAVGGAVAPHPVGRALAEQVLDVQLARLVGDRPGGEGMAEAMGMDPGDSRGSAQPPQQLLEPVGLEPHARMEPPVAAGYEQRPEGRNRRARDFCAACSAIGKRRGQSPPDLCPGATEHALFVACANIPLAETERRRRWESGSNARGADTRPAC